MLKLKKIQILGFKSFSDRTELSLAGDGIAAVVGPNGCGKSNISDAITWVLGEQSAKSLRGSKMEDVIFAGTAGRKPTGMAEVSLTLVDPDVYDGHGRHSEGPELVIAEHRDPTHLPDDWNEGELRRRMEGETEEAITEAQPGIPLQEPADGGPAERPRNDPEAVSADDVVLRIRRRKFNRAPVRAGEITVTRRLFRTGDSEYLLNGKICRLRDIQDIFLGTGLGGESYAMIGQERIGQMLSSKPLDRRAIIEEAAGITRFKTKKRLAELRLESARQNLARINDIFEEVARQIGSLKRQAAKAERYGALRDELRDKLRVVLASRLHQMDGEQEQVSAEITSLNGEVETRVQTIGEEDSRHAAAVQRGYDLDESARVAGQEAHQLAVELERTAARLAGNLDRSVELEARVAAALVDTESAQAQQGALAHEAEQHRVFLAQAEQEATAARGLAGQHAAEAAEAARATTASEVDAERRRRDILSLLQRAAQTRNEQAQAVEALAALDREHERLLRESDAARSDLDALGVQRGQTRLSFESTSERLQRLETELGTLRLDLEAKRATEADRRRHGDTLRRELAAVHGSRSSLESLLRDHSFSTDTVKELLRRARKLSEGDADRTPVGTLADLLEVEGTHGKAIDDLLRDELDYIVLPGWAAAEDCVGLLRSEIAGRATLLVQSPDTTQDEVGTTPSPELGAIPGLSRVLDHVRYPEAMSALVRNLPRLRDGFLAANTTQAREQAQSFPTAWFVTPEGEVYHGRGITAGRSAVGGPLALKRELRDANTRASALEAEAAQCETETATLVREIAEIVSSIDTRGAARREAEREAANSGAALQQMESEAARIERRLAEWQLASERNRDQRNSKTDLIARHAETAEALDRERSELDAGLSALQDTLQSLRQRREELQGAASASAAQLAALEERRRNAKGSADQTERMLAAQTARIAQLEQQIAASEAEKTRRADETITLHAQREDLQVRQTAAHAQIAAVAAESTELRRHLEAMDHQLRTGRAELDALRQRRSDLAVRSARLGADKEHLEASCRTDLNTEPDDLRHETTIARIAGDSLAEQEAECLTLKQRLENMGPVNMMALEEFTEASGRHSFLETQRADLLASIENTQASIREIDDVSRTKFDEAFTAINANFSVAFEKLFAGGHATMKLTDVENAAESGVDIVASPPGKKPQNILLLSGGEKALTALGLLVAIFQFQPAPFCVLDEVDAPLDEVNVGRFTRLLGEMSATTQFIVITHSKRTMQSADVIYGVTMQEPGVSKIVSVNLGDRRADQDRRRAVA